MKWSKKNCAYDFAWDETYLCFIACVFRFHNLFQFCDKKKQ